jgi:hypothetical protein
MRAADIMTFKTSREQRKEKYRKRSGQVIAPQNMPPVT